MEPDTLNSGSNGPITGCNFSAFISFPACFVLPQNNGARNGNGLQIMGDSDPTLRKLMICGDMAENSGSLWFIKNKTGDCNAAC